jgi:mono/diheme cytochrome c family protein
VWAGGLLGLAIAVVPWQGAMPAPVLAGIARRFSRVAGLCLVAVIATGIANAWWQLGGGSRLWTTAYGRVLIVKVLVVVGLAWLGAVNRYVVLPRLGGGRTANGLGRRVFRIARLVFRGRRRGDAERAARFWLSAYVKREAALAVLVLACTAALREVTPGRHTAFERRPSSHVTNIVSSPTGGGVRVSGTVTPPAGDAARGRALFVKLGCFACHAVGEERFTAPSRPGPDLTAIGRRHPGYLVESVMNPNARIVDGPGYTDARGLSTMPDYRDRITVGDLIDLVAFLGSLRG